MVDGSRRVKSEGRVSYLLSDYGAQVRGSESVDIYQPLSLCNVEHTVPERLLPNIQIDTR